MRFLKFIVVCVVTLSFKSYATHNRAGEITYKWLYGYTYEIKITTYTNIDFSAQIDKCEDSLNFGDGSKVVAVLRSNGSPTANCPRNGIEIIAGKTKLNEYVTTHTYPGPGNYKLSMEDPNRNIGVTNLPNSGNQVFYIESYLVISTFLGQNNSPVLSFPPIDNGCVGRCFYHNPGASDIDGDSLSYELTDCRGSDGVPIVGYEFPVAGSGGTYNIDAVTGTLTWCVPQLQGEYNLALIIKEWRKTFDGDRVLVGYVLRDLQVVVGTCNNNNPSIQPITDTCVLAGSLINRIIRATDSDLNLLTLSANGGPFLSNPPIATFASSTGVSPVSGIFSWSTVCSHIRKAPYPVVIKVADSDPRINLVDFKTFNITVVAPPPINLEGKPIGSNMNLKWQKPTCQQKTGNKIEKYCVYRKVDCTPWNHSTCETGVPAYTGFELIGCTASINDTTFLDTNNGNGLTQGTNYSYLVIAVFTDGAESYASNQICVQLKRDVPVLINVDVKSTSTTTGSIFVRWIKPLLNPTTALDTIALPGPYEMRLLYYIGFSANTYTTIYSVTKPYFAGINQLADTTFTHLNINTNDFPFTYKIDFYANGIFVGSTQKASSVFLTSIPNDNQLQLSWTQKVPWTNYKYRIWRKLPSSSVFVLRDSTNALSYTDINLVNRATYCYKIEAIGQYSDPGIYKPLINFSQEICDKPIDKTPPCAPILETVSDCKIPTLSLKWNNPNLTCADDVVKYNLYEAVTDESELILKDSITISTNTIFAFDNLTSLAGCYAVSAVDSFGNESLQIKKICLDNCPEYELPNVITINDDGVNDFFKPIKNKFVKDIDLKIYDRWGSLVFETTDPKILWNGIIKQSKQLCSEGTYFYVCQVNEIRLSGIKPRYLKGFLQVFTK